MVIALRILSGLHSGAYIKLNSGDWQLGSNPLCDILISDIEPKQITVRIDTSGKVTVYPSQNDGVLTENYHNDEVVPENGLEIPLYTCLCLGSIYVAFGEDNVTWPHIALPLQKNLKQRNSETTQAQDSSSSIAQDANLNIEHQGQEKIVANKGNVNNSALNINKNKSLDLNPLLGAKSKSKSRFFSYFVIFTLLIILIFGVFWMTSTPKSIEDRRQTIQEIIDEVIALNNESTANSHVYSYPLSIVQNKDNTWKVCGAVQSINVQNTLTAKFQELPFAVSGDVVVFSDVLQKLNSHIQSKKSLLQVRPMHDKLRVMGYIYDEKTLNDLLAPLQNDLKCLPIQNDATYWQKLQTQALENLTAFGLQNEVRLIPEAYGIVLEYHLVNSDKQELLKTFEQEIAYMTGGVSPFSKISLIKKGLPPQTETKTVSRPKNINEFCQHITIKKQDNTFVVIYGGKSFAQGTRLPSGLQVKEVTDEYVAFALDQRLLFCPK